MSTADDIAPTSTLSDGPPLDAAQRLGLARFRLGPDAPPWLMETLAFARDEVARLTHERDDAQRMAAAWEQAGANARLTERLVRGDLDAERRSAAAHAEWYARRIVAGIAGAMGLDTSGEGDEIHARILAEHARLVGAVAAERARCAARVRGALHGIESGDTGADGDVVLTAVTRLTRERDEARAAIAADLHCDECGEVATRHHHEPARKHGGDDCACDTHSTENSDGYWADLPHAAAVRAAKVTT